MKRNLDMKHRFVEYIPSQMESDVLYISIEFDVAKHLCPCGCKSVIVTSLSPARWKLIYDGETVSLRPSVGNWTLNCKSHYFITNDKVEWAGAINQQQVDAVLESDHSAIEKHVEGHQKPLSIYEKLKKWLGVK